MSSFSRFSAILFALMLTLVSISRNQYEVLPPALVQGTDGDYHSTTVSEKKLLDACFAERSGEQLISSVNNLPAPVSKIHPTGFLGGSFSIEFRTRVTARQLLSCLETVFPRLRGSTIIFPFHYFW